MVLIDASPQMLELAPGGVDQVRPLFARPVTELQGRSCRG
jgi:hypothetical protein